MTAPPGLAPTEESPSPSDIGSTDGCHLPRRITKRIVSDFMAMFPGMPAARALNMAREFVADPDAFQANMRRAKVGTENLERLARLMEELPLGISKRPRRRDERPEVLASRQRWRANRGLASA